MTWLLISRLRVAKGIFPFGFSLKSPHCPAEHFRNHQYQKRNVRWRNWRARGISRNETKPRNPMLNAMYCETSQKLAKMLCGGIGLPKNVTKMILRQTFNFLKHGKMRAIMLSSDTKWRKAARNLTFRGALKKVRKTSIHRHSYRKNTVNYFIFCNFSAPEKATFADNQRIKDWKEAFFSAPLSREPPTALRSELETCLFAKAECAGRCAVKMLTCVSETDTEYRFSTTLVNTAFQTKLCLELASRLNFDNHGCGSAEFKRPWLCARLARDFVIRRCGRVFIGRWEALRATSIVEDFG